DHVPARRRSLGPRDARRTTRARHRRAPQRAGALTEARVLAEAFEERRFAENVGGVHRLAPHQHEQHIGRGTPYGDIALRVLAREVDPVGVESYQPLPRRVGGVEMDGSGFGEASTPERAEDAEVLVDAVGCE